MFKEMTNVSSNQSSLFHKYIYIKFSICQVRGFWGAARGIPEVQGPWATGLALLESPFPAGRVLCKAC